ncbi:MAG: DUF2237 domain-containing protein [Cyanobacteria bacterium J06560_2]
MPRKRSSDNVLGGLMRPCCTDPMTGFFRDGACHTSSKDTGSHSVCAEMTEAFLTYTKAQGNDLSTPQPASDFPGLKPGDKWCLCASRWKEALDDGVAPPVVLEATNVAALKYVSIDDLKANATQ